MTKESLAALMNGREYMEEIDRPEEMGANEAGLVAIFGYSDDNVELRGAIHDELGAYNGKKFHLHRKGILIDLSGGDCSHCTARALKLQPSCVEINAQWSVNGYSWFIETKIDHAAFDIMEDGEKFCRGIVISVSDLPEI